MAGIVVTLVAEQRYSSETRKLHDACVSSRSTVVQMVNIAVSGFQNAITEGIAVVLRVPQLAFVAIFNVSVQ